MDGARGAVEVLTEFAALVLLDQRLQRLVFGGARLTQQSAAGGKTATEQAEKGTAVGALWSRGLALGIAVSTKMRLAPAPSGGCGRHCGQPRGKTKPRPQVAGASRLRLERNYRR